MSPLVHGLLYGAVVGSVLLTATAWGVWVERKLGARIHTRLGPTMVGPAGLLQPLADALKLLQKETIIPRDADRTLFRIAPPFMAIFSLATAAVVPLAPDLVAADLDVGVLYVLAVSGLMLFPVWVSGWASNNKYALLGAMRAIAQGVSYEVPLVLSALVPVVLAGSMSLSDIVAYQVEHGWFVAWPPGPGLVAFVIFFVASLAEANRIPFDIPEAESELVAGVTTEYSGMKFGFFYLAEYLHTLVSSAVASVLFLGGWHGPFSDGLHWLVLKTLVLFLFVIQLRWTLVRFRADQLMTLAWKWLVPVSLVALMAAAVAVLIMSGGA